MKINNLKLSNIKPVLSKKNTIETIKSLKSIKSTKTISYEDSENFNSISSNKEKNSYFPQKLNFSSNGIISIKKKEMISKINRPYSSIKISYKKKIKKPLSNSPKRVKKTLNKSISDIKPFYPKKVSGINISFLRKQIKCEKLKNEIILNHQFKFYSPKNYFEPFNEVPRHNFLRNNIKSRNLFKPSFPYDKNEIFNKENPIKYGFRTEYKKEKKKKQKNHNSKKLNNFRKIVKKMNNLNLDIYKKNEKLTKELSKLNKRCLSDNNKNKTKKKIQSFKLNNSYHKICQSYEINIDKLLDNNANKVKIRLEPKIHKYLNSVVNQVKYEQKFKTYDQDEYTEFSMKNKILQFEKDFKLVSFENMNLKRKLKLKDFYEKEKETEAEKMKRYVNNLTEQWDNEDFLKYEIYRNNIIKNFQPLLPTPITQVKVKKLCEILKEN